MCLRHCPNVWLVVYFFAASPQKNIPPAVTVHSWLCGVVVVGSRNTTPHRRMVMACSHSTISYLKGIAENHLLHPVLGLRTL
jgi:hypothetical protein